MNSAIITLIKANKSQWGLEGGVRTQKPENFDSNLGSTHP